MLELAPLLPMNDWESTPFFCALRRRPTSRRPLWLMRQAGRYLPEYRALRKKEGGFLAMAQNPAIACEITLQPVRRFDFDAAIIFSDILTIPDAMGLGLFFSEGEGPRFERPLQSEDDIVRLHPAPLEKLEYVGAACTLTRQALPAQTPLIGFCGAPFTLACYMIDGGSGGFWRTREMRFSRPDLLHQVLAMNAASCADLLCAQVAAGCQAVMIFDSWGGLLGGDEYEQFSLAYIRRVVAAVKEKTTAPVIVFGRQCGLHLPAIAACGCDAVGVDWQTPLRLARRMVGERVAIQGNLDPAALLGTPDSVAAAAQNTLADYGDGDGHIFNLGHGVDKNTPPENVAALVEAVRG